MVIARLIGGFGNNLFQLANGLNLAKNLNTEFRTNGIPRRGMFGDYNGHRFEFLDIFEDAGFIDPGCRSSYHYNHADLNDRYNFRYLNVPLRDDTSYEGYFQSDKYFKDINIKEHFRFRKDKIDEVTKKYDLSENNTSIHFQYGKDRSSDRLQQYHKYVSVDYYKKALNKIDNPGKIYVVSNDIDRVKNETISQLGIEPIYVDDNMVNSFILMSLCNNNIIGNSTFSWWAAYMNVNENNTVIAPKTEWFGPARMHMDLQDLFPKKWITL